MISPLSLNIIRYNYRLGAYAGWSVTDSNGLSTFVESGTMNVWFGIRIVLYAACCQCHGGKNGTNQYLSFIHNLCLFNNYFAIDDKHTLRRISYTLTIQVVVLLNVER